MRQALLSASRAPLDRLLQPLRVPYRRRTTTRPAHRLWAHIPSRTEWPEQTPGYLEVDTVALCGGCRSTARIRLQPERPRVQGCAARK